MSTDLQINDAPGSSGTAMLYNAPNTSSMQASRTEQNPSGHEDMATPEGGEVLADEQPLESHEVIELQSFSDRKVWIEQKIEFLEKLPPIEVFTGLDAVRASAENVPGLPTREQLQQWMEERDAIEKETDIFDRGELTKLRQLTKAATQRNLSPADTDLIEITLTTIYTLDKLLHLLRDRSENLELLSLRLDWEECRIAAWVDRRNIVEDLRSFLQTRANWNPSVYDNATLPTEDTHTLSRRGSTASFASAMSGASDATVSSAKYSRTSRFKLAEVLSRDAALYSARLTALRHGKIAAAGKLLDKLIDQSRKPVPEELLDEQDRLEEKGINDLETIGKFIMGVVMQWRKADEIYVETLKDKTAAQDLAEEIDMAKTNHPTARQSAAYASRVDTLLKRLALRGNPSSPISTFPRPETTLFEEQQASNKALVEFLSMEIATATEIAKKVDAQAKEYRTNYDAVKRVEGLVSDAETCLTAMKNTLARIEQGVHPREGHDGDGSPPDLSSRECLELSRHSAFIALLPSMLDEMRETSEKAQQVLRESGLATPRLNFAGIDPAFTQRAIQTFRELSGLDRQLQESSENTRSKVDRLKLVRRIWQAITDHLKLEEEARERILELMESRRWQRVSGKANGLATPESLRASPLPQELTFSQVKDQLDQWSSSILDQIDRPMTDLAVNLEPVLRSWMTSHVSGLNIFHQKTLKMARLLEGVQRQADAMRSADENFNALMLRVEVACAGTEARINSVLGDSTDFSDRAAIEEELPREATAIREALDNYIDGLQARISIIGRHQEFTHNKSNVIKRRMLDTQVLLEAQSEMIVLPFDLASLDSEVRADMNYFAMRLNGKFELLSRLHIDYRTACHAREVDQLTANLITSVALAEEEFISLKKTLSETHGADDKLYQLQELSSQLSILSMARNMDTPRALSPIHQLIRQIEQDSPQTSLLAHRLNLVNDVELRFRRWQDDVASLGMDIEHRIGQETQKLAQETAEKAIKHSSQLEKPLPDTTPPLGEPFQLDNSPGGGVSERVLDIKEAPLTLEDLVVNNNEGGEHDYSTREENRVTSPAETIVPMRELRSPDGLPGMDLIIPSHTEPEFAQSYSGGARSETPGRTTPHKHPSPSRIPAIKGRWSPARRREGSPLVSSPLIRSVQDRIRELDSEDPFGPRAVRGTPPKDTTFQLQNQISSLRKRLLSLGINQLCRPARPNSPLPKQSQYKKLDRDFAAITADVSQLPDVQPNSPLRVQIDSLMQEMEFSSKMMKRIAELARLSGHIEGCDAALSDFLEHIDSYPALPCGELASSHRSTTSASPEDQLSARVAFTRKTVDQVIASCSPLNDDDRATSEKNRVLQTWTELEEMASERLEKKTRPPSTTSSLRTSSRTGSVSSSRNSRGARKTSAYANLSASSSQKSLAVPKQPVSRRIVSNEPSKTKPPPRLSHMDHRQSQENLPLKPTPRSVSGPLRSSLYGSTFASRQRTASLSNSTPISTPQPAVAPSTRPRKMTLTRRAVSPSPSEVSFATTRTHTRSSTSISTWSKAPRNSLSSLFPDGKLPTPLKGPPSRRKYVADPKNKLDVAVGEVVNNLPVGINVEGVSESWKDQSGKYWIGNQDPKLCFCRILRSQTVMVRVGGGWSELSKFIKDHFAESFRLLPESPPRQGKEEKWISSATLLEHPEPGSPPRAPRTPEPPIAFVTNFAFETPRRSPGSFNGSPSASGSPLTPMQFIRRADIDSMMRPVTPTKPPTLQVRNNNSTARSPMRTSIWRP